MLEGMRELRLLFSRFCMFLKHVVIIKFLNASHVIMSKPDDYCVE